MTFKEQIIKMIIDGGKVTGFDKEIFRTLLDQFELDLRMEISRTMKNNLLICTGCGRINIESLGKNRSGNDFLKCCDVNNYVSIKEYFEHSKY